MKTTTASADPQAFHTLQEMVREIDVAMMTTVTPDGALHSRPMVTAAFDDEGTIWFFTSTESAMVHDLDAEHAVNLSYAHPRKHRYVSVTGSASLVRDREKARQLWRPALKTYFPGGPDDEHLGLLAARIETAEYWEGGPSKVRSLFSGPKQRQNRDAADGAEHTKVDIRATPASG